MAEESIQLTGICGFVDKYLFPEDAELARKICRNVADMSQQPAKQFHVSVLGARGLAFTTPFVAAGSAIGYSTGGVGKFCTNITKLPAKEAFKGLLKDQLSALQCLALTVISAAYAVFGLIFGSWVFNHFVPNAYDTKNENEDLLSKIDLNATLLENRSQLIAALQSKAALIEEKITLTNEKATLTNEKTTLVNEKATLVNEKATLALDNSRLLTEKVTLTNEKNSLTTRLHTAESELKDAESKILLLEEKFRVATYVPHSLIAKITAFINQKGCSDAEFEALFKAIDLGQLPSLEKQLSDEIYDILAKYKDEFEKPGMQEELLELYFTRLKSLHQTILDLKKGLNVLIERKNKEYLEKTFELAKKTMIANLKDLRRRANCMSTSKEDNANMQRILEAQSRGEDYHMPNTLNPEKIKLEKKIKELETILKSDASLKEHLISLTKTKSEQPLFDFKTFIESMDDLSNVVKQFKRWHPRRLKVQKHGHVTISRKRNNVKVKVQIDLAEVIKATFKGLNLSPDKKATTKGSDTYSTTKFV